MKIFPSRLESINDLTIDHITHLFTIAKKYKNFPSKIEKKTDTIVSTLFLEDSTRTKLSFQIAATKLGGSYIDLPPEQSSLKKGESLIETLHTLKGLGVDICIIRSSQEKIISELPPLLPLKIINGGDGTHQHPTQGLIDIFTLDQLWSGKLENKTVTLIGDCIHSRVANSLIDITDIFNINLILSGPKEFLPEGPLPSHVQIIKNQKEALEVADAIYLLRVQKERHKSRLSISDEKYHKDWGLNLEKYQSLKKDPPILHPGPANIGLEISKNLIESKYYQGHLQVKNSVFLRMALILCMIQNNDK